MTQTTQPFPGFNVPPVPEIFQPIQSPPTQFSGWLLNGIDQRDQLVSQLQIIQTGSIRSLWLVSVSSVGQSEVEILPYVRIQRVGSSSRPYRLLSGKEVILSEDDVRVMGISKRYSLSDIWYWGCQYVLDPVRVGGNGLIDLENSTVHELVFIQDDNPLTWTLNLRKKDDSRLSQTDYDIP